MNVRKFVAGINADGRSCIVDEGGVTPDSNEGILGLRTATLWSSRQSPKVKSNWTVFAMP